MEPFLLNVLVFFLSKHQYQVCTFSKIQTENETLSNEAITLIKLTLQIWKTSGA